MARGRHCVDCANLYAAFVAVAALLRNGGQLVAITPRSFANGRYFTAFHRWLTDAASFRRVVLFERRDRVSGSSSVLQETVIFSMGRSSVAASGAAVRVETRWDHLSAPHEAHDVSHDRIVSPGDAQARRRLADEGLQARIMQTCVRSHGNLSP